MFRWFKPNPVKKLDKKYYELLKEAMLAQRSGDIRRYSELTAEAEDIREQLSRLESVSD